MLDQFDHKHLDKDVDYFKTVVRSEPFVPLARWLEHQTSDEYVVFDSSVFLVRVMVLSTVCRPQMITGQQTG